MQAGTCFPKVRRMLLFGAPLFLTHLWPASTLLRGHLTLATLSLRVNDPQILERWGCAHEVHLGILVSNVCVTCNGFREYWNFIIHQILP